MKVSTQLFSLLVTGIAATSPVLLNGLSPRSLAPLIQAHGRSPATSQPAHTYVAFEASSPEMQKLSRTVLFYIARRSQQSHYQQPWIAVDLFNGSTIQTLYSHQADPQRLQALIPQINGLESSDYALIKAIQRFKDEAHQHPKQSIYGLIVTEGSSDPETLKIIEHSCQKLAQLAQVRKRQALRLNLVGLASEHRLVMSRAVSPLGDRVHFASRTYEEWNQMIQF